MNLKNIIITLLLLTSIASAADTSIPTVTVITTVSDNNAHITGNAGDTSNDINITAGVQRVELQIDGSAWTTASGTTTYNYTYSDLSNGYHVVGVRSIDDSNNPSTIKYKTFLVDSEAETEIDDLSWYITISDAHFETVDDIFNVRTVTSDVDVRLRFTVNNDADTERKLRYTISRGTFEVSDDIIIKAGDTIEVDEWVVASVLTQGTNRFEISIDDWTTKTVVATKDVTITLSDTADTTSKSTEDIPVWFQTVAELNNISLDPSPVNVEYTAIMDRLDTLDETNKVQQQEIKNLQAKLAQPQVQTQSASAPASAESKQLIAGYDNIWLVLVAAVGLYMYNKKNPGKLFGGSTSTDVPDAFYDKDPNEPIVK